ncbi:cytochrome c [Rhodoblastus sp.]|jgi:cytochrome c55X|uniref:c-type cytochrome n=1 Tax=Rhodoblastus sp. TaxID=1962975 RepID=UPI00262D4FB6|nr:cytochrome c [Rhodoblastus sp.]
MIKAALMLTTVALLAPACAAAQQPRDKLVSLVRQDCGSCHGLTLKGGLGPSLLPQALAGKDADALAAIILNGVPETPMPPWKGELSPDDALWIATRLKEGFPR